MKRINKKHDKSIKPYGYTIMDCLPLHMNFQKVVPHWILPMELWYMILTKADIHVRMVCKNWNNMYLRYNKFIAWMVNKYQSISPIVLLFIKLTKTCNAFNFINYWSFKNSYTIYNNTFHVINLYSKRDTGRIYDRIELHDSKYAIHINYDTDYTDLSLIHISLYNNGSGEVCCNYKSEYQPSNEYASLVGCYDGTDTVLFKAQEIMTYLNIYHTHNSDTSLAEKAASNLIKTINIVDAD